MRKTVQWNRASRQRITKAFQQSCDSKAIAYLGIAAFEEKLNTGFARDLETKQAEWKDLHPAYARAKKRANQSPLKWVRTGKLQKAITNNVPQKVGTRRGLQYQIDWRKDFAYVYPTVLKKYGRLQTIYFTLNAYRPLFVWHNSDFPIIQRHLTQRMEHIFSTNGLLA